MKIKKVLIHLSDRGKSRNDYSASISKSKAHILRLTLG
nr:MAG TPA: hypothetical protein [Caudoviricetes sp.]